MASVARALATTLLALSVASAGCSEDNTSAPEDAGASMDTASADSGSPLDATEADSRPADSAPVDSGAPDTSSPDAGPADIGTSDTAPADTGTPDTGLADTGSPDTGADTAPADPCSPLPSGLTTWTKTDSASVGTPDTYFFSVNPGDPFCATITGGGSGTWSINVSNGTSSGVYCSGSPKCSIVVPPGQLTLLATAVTTDIGGYTLTVRYRPR
jgi:hypothetical protein